MRSEQRLHSLSAPEKRNGLASDRNQSPCAGISSGPAFPKLHKKTPSSEACWASKVWPSVLTRAYPTIISSSTYFVSLADSWGGLLQLRTHLHRQFVCFIATRPITGHIEGALPRGVRRAVAPALINVWLNSNARLRATRLALAQRLQEVQATEYAARWEFEYERVEAKHAEYPQAHGPIGRHLRGVRRSTRRSRASTVQRLRGAS